MEIIYGITKVVNNEIPNEFKESKDVRKYVMLHHQRIREDIIGGVLFRSMKDAIKFLKTNYNVKETNKKDIFIDDEKNKYYIFEYELE